MRNFTVRRFHNAAFFHCAKRLLVELDGAGSVADSHIWSNGVETLRYGFSGHDSPPKDEKLGPPMLHQNAETVCQRSMKSGDKVSRFQFQGFNFKVSNFARFEDFETLKRETLKPDSFSGFPEVGLRKIW